MTVPHESDLSVRRGKLAETLPDLEAEGFLVTALSNARYLSGFTGSNAAVLLTRSRAILFTDPRYETQAPAESDCEVRVARGPLLKQVITAVRRLRLRRVAFEANRIGFNDYRLLTEDARGVSWVAATDVVETLRMIKSADETATIKASVQLNSLALKQSLRHFKPEMTELDLAAEIEYRMRRLGADGAAFDTIVASGKRSALPHAHPTDQPIVADQLLLIDMGARVAGYASDMTRTYAVGRISSRVRRMYRAVQESQLAALDAVKPGVKCSEVDAAARRILRGFKMDKLFIHSTGHGLGLEIHENPRLGRRERTKLEAGMVITIEPGVYWEGVGGIRIEDTVAVTSHGCEVLTPTGKELVVL